MHGYTDTDIDMPRGKVPHITYACMHGGCMDIKKLPSGHLNR